MWQHQLVQDLCALTCALCYLSDDVAWLTVLRAPWCGLDLHDLYQIKQQGVDQGYWYLITNELDLSRLSQEGQNRLKRLIFVMNEALIHRRRSLAQWV